MRIMSANHPDSVEDGARRGAMQQSISNSSSRGAKGRQC